MKMHQIFNFLSFRPCLPRSSILDKSIFAVLFRALPFVDAPLKHTTQLYKAYDIILTAL